MSTTNTTMVERVLEAIGIELDDEQRERLRKRRAWLRRGGPLLDFISANFLYILTLVAVAGVAGTAYFNYERSTYARDMRSIHTAIAQYPAHAPLRNLTLPILARYLPDAIEVIPGANGPGDTTSGLFFGGLLGDALPAYVYGGGGTTGEAIGASSARQLVLVAGDVNRPINETPGICVDLVRTVGPGVRSVQVRNAQGPIARAGGTTAVTSVAAGAMILAVQSTGGTWSTSGGGAATDEITFTKRRQAQTAALDTIGEDARIEAACNRAQQAIQVVYVFG